jgi:hypothetical protein
MLPNWVSFKNTMWVLTTLLIPLTLGYITNQYQNAQNKRQADDARLRLYTELLSKREEADTSVRKGIFDKVLETYLKPGGKDLEAKLVALELLALNFNDSLDLSPLFWQLDREVRQPAKVERRAFLVNQLDRITNAVKDRQIEVLESVGASKEADINIDGLQNDSGKAIDVDLSFVDPDSTAFKEPKFTRHFTVEVAEHDPVGRRVWIFVTHRGINGKDTLSGFWVDVFDFPLTNFVRASKSERFTVVMQRYKPPRAGLTLVYYPSSRSGVKDKPFIDEVISNLKRDANRE